MKFWQGLLIGCMGLFLVACDAAVNLNDTGNDDSAELIGGESGRVTNIIDGDTIDVLLDGEEIRVRYVGVNTPERDEVCYQEAKDANRALVEGQTVRLVQDVSETDRYGRLLRYVYVGDTFVNEALVAEGYAEVVLYEPDDGFYEEFLRFESNAARNNLNCHATGIFNDNNSTR